MEEKEYKVVTYLKILKKYLIEDLQLFVQLCKKAEEREKEMLEELDELDDSFITTTYQITNFELENDFFVARSTIPHTLALFAVIDIIGFLIGKDHSFRNTGNNFKSFLKKLSIIEVEVLIDTYRHGLVHSFFPKSYMAIAYRTEYPDDKMFLCENNRLILNVKCLINIVNETLCEVIKDKSLHFTMQNQYDFLVGKYKKRSSKDIENLKLML